MTTKYNPPYFVICNEGYDNIMKQLKKGERYMKSYMGTCPHKDTCECKCYFYLNFLQDGKLVRFHNGKIKKVYKESEIVDIVLCNCVKTA